MEDDMMAFGKWKREFQFGTMGNATRTQNNIDSLLQKMSNEVISLKKQINRPIHSFHQPY